MAVYDLEEQDKLEDLKAWWKQWGNSIAGIVIAVSIGVIGVQGWRWWTQQQAAKAAVLYDAVSAAARANDPAKAKEAMAQLADRYGGTGYAPRGALLVAALLFENGDAAGAKAQLAFVIDKSDDDELKQIARLRLAAILFDEKQYDEALRTLDARHDPSFAGLYADLRGDILVAAGRIDDARTAYQTAITQLDAKSPYRGFVQLKLDALPSSAAAAGAGPAATAGAGTAPATARAAAPAPAASAAAAGAPVAGAAASGAAAGAPVAGVAPSGAAGGAAVAGAAAPSSAATPVTPVSK
jgi:predicted negative regulator of RcsB-dependent stress response